MSGVCGCQRRCGDWECPYSVCDGCPIAEVMDAAGIARTESPGELFELLDEIGGAE